VSSCAEGQSQFAVKCRAIIAAHASALAGFIARGGLVDNVNTSLAANQLVVAVAEFQGLERILDLHNRDRSVFARAGNEKRAFQRAAKVDGP
jgi:uncharacterized protein (DUF1330 family)